MEFTLVDPWVRIVAIIIGLAGCFYGYPLFRIFLVLAGLFYGFLYGQAFYPASHPLLALLIGVVLAVVLAVLAYPLWSLGVVLIGAALGFIIVGELGVVFNLPEIGVLLVGALGAAALGFFFYRTRDLFVMVATAFNGAMQVVYGLGLFHGALAIGLGRTNILAAVAIALLGATGFAIQYGMFKEERRYSV